MGFRPETPDASAAWEAVDAIGAAKAGRLQQELERIAAEVKQIEEMREGARRSGAGSAELKRIRSQTREAARVSRRSRAAQVNDEALRNRISFATAPTARKSPPVASQHATAPPKPARATRRAPAAQTAQGIKSRPPVPATVSPLSPSIAHNEAIAARQARETRDEVIRFLRMAGLTPDVEELIELEQKLRRRSQRDLIHAAFSSRLILTSVADRIFPARQDPWQDLEGNERAVGMEEVGNRLSAFVDQHLGGLEPAARSAFQGELDGLKRWVGRGPHGVHTACEADCSYVRLLSVLAIVAKAFDAAIAPVQGPAVQSA